MATVTGGIGDIKMSALDEPEFQAQNGNYWVMIDGRSIAGSKLAGLTGVTTLPDQRGEGFRAASAGRSLLTENEDIILAGTNVGTDQMVLLGAPANSWNALAVGQRVSFTSTGIVPAPLVSGNTYYVLPINTTTFRVASSQANAAAGTFIDITATPTGTTTVHIFRPPGSFQSDMYVSHAHGASHNLTGNVTMPQNESVQSGGGSGVNSNDLNQALGITVANSGGNETRPRTIAWNAYIRIN